MGKKILNSETERFGELAIDNHLKLGGLLNGRSPGFAAYENAINIGRRLWFYLFFFFDIGMPTPIAIPYLDQLVPGYALGQPCAGCCDKK